MKIMYNTFMSKIAAFFREPSKEDGYKCAEKWISEGTYNAEVLSVLSDGTFNRSDFDLGIRDYLREYYQKNINLE